MRKILVALIIVLAASTSSLAVQINPDTELHKTIGGLYALVSALAVSDSVPEKAESLRECFDDVPSKWADSVTLEKVEDDVWVGVSVETSPSSKNFLRSHSSELGISDKPGGKSWVSGKLAWLKAGEFWNGKFVPVKIRASYGEGKDSNILFFSARGQDSWWHSYPELSRKTAVSVMKIYGENKNGLHRPEGAARSIYNEVRPSAVRKPADIHTKREKTFEDDLERQMGDVIFRPGVRVGGQESR